jgi:S-layer protein (TIGR01567 family)
MLQKSDREGKMGGQKMRKQVAVALVSVMFLLATAMVAGAVDKVQVRSSVQTVVEGATFSWDPQNFAGFYYDIDDNLGSENIRMTITNNKLEEPYGVTYTTTSQLNDFEFEDWGWYNSIGFLGDEYFAGYSEKRPVVYGQEINPELYRRSTDRNLLIDEQILKVLEDDDTERTITSGTPLRLQEGYELSIKSIDVDGNRVYLELSKNGAIVDSKVISPSKDGAIMADKTYCYKKDIGDTKNIAIIAAYFKNAFRGADQNLATVDGIFQVSDTATNVKVDTEYSKMRIASVTPYAITMDNKDNSITLNKNQETVLMGGIGIKTANQDSITDESPLRFCLYKEVTGPGVYELRGQVQAVIDGYTSSWDPQNFAGFYYNIDDNLGTESITATITGNRLEEPSGLMYSTAAQMNRFGYSDWGYYNAIGFMGKKCFAGYIHGDSAGTNPDLLEGANAVNLLGFGILTEILVDKSQKTVQDLSSAIDLEEGYSLRLTIGTDKKGVLAELLKDEKVVDKKAVLLPGTYVYTSNIGNAKGIPIISARFEEPIFLENKSYFKVDGIWQISENPIQVSKDSHYGIMTVSSVDSASGVITLDNQDNSLTLSKDKNIPLMGDLRIRTADQDNINDTDPIRYCMASDIEIAYPENETGSTGGMA